MGEPFSCGAHFVNMREREGKEQPTSLAKLSLQASLVKCLCPSLSPCALTLPLLYQVGSGAGYLALSSTSLTCEHKARHAPPSQEEALMSVSFAWDAPANGGLQIVLQKEHRYVLEPCKAYLVIHEAFPSAALTGVVRLLMAQRTRRMSRACHMSSPKTALHILTTSPT